MLIRVKQLNNLNNRSDIDEFFFNMSKNISLNNVLEILSLLYAKSQVGFKISCNLVDKKYRKKLKKKYLFKLDYLTKSKRLSYFFKVLSLIISKSTGRGLNNKFIKVLSSSILSFPQSELSGFKTLTLKHLTKKNK